MKYGIVLLLLLLMAIPALADDGEAVDVDLDQMYLDLDELSLDGTLPDEPGAGIDLGESLVTDARSLAMRLGDFSALSIIDHSRFGAARDLATLLERLPGVDVRSLGGYGQLSTVSLRGASSGQLIVLLDGQPLSPQDGADLAGISPAMLERIEVLRGPQALQFGPGALGGIVNLVSLQAAPAEEPIQSYADSGLSFKEYFHELCRQEFEKKQDPAQQAQTGYAALAGSHGLLGLEFSRSAPGEIWQLRREQADNDYSYERADGSSAIRRNAQFSRNELLGSWSSGNSHYRLGMSDLSRGVPGSAEFPTLTSRLDRSAVWLQHTAGERSDALSLQYTHVRDPHPYLNRGEIDNADLLLHAQQEYRRGRWLWRPRLDYATGDSVDSELRAALDASSLSVEQHGVWQWQYGWGLTAASDNGIDPLASLALRRDFGSSGTAWLGLAHAVRQPSFDELYLSDSGSVRGNPKLAPERVDSVELGYRRSLADARLEATAFYSIYEDSIIFAPVSAYLVEARNTGRAWIAGTESSFDWQLSPHWWWNASASWLPLAQYQGGTPLTGRSSLHAGSGLQYETRDWSALASLDHSSAIPADLFGNLRTDPRSLVNLELNLGRERRFSLALTNVFDRTARDSWNYPLPGRELSLSWSSET